MPKVVFTVSQSLCSISVSIGELLIFFVIKSIRNQYSCDLMLSIWLVFFSNSIVWLCLFGWFVFSLKLWILGLINHLIKCDIFIIIFFRLFWLILKQCYRRWERFFGSLAITLWFFGSMRKMWDFWGYRNIIEAGENGKGWEIYKDINEIET